MNVLICYATTEGQTRKIALYAAEYIIRHDYTVATKNADSAEDLDIGAFDAVILAGSVHIGRHQSALDHFVRSRVDQLNAVPTAFLSVSLSAAGDEDDKNDARKLSAGFLESTGWKADMVLDVAGAFRFTRYDFFKRWAMRFIAMKHGEDVDSSQDKEYTDWNALEGFLDQFLDHLKAG